MASIASGLLVSLLMASAEVLYVDSNTEVLSPDGLQVYENLTSALLFSVETNLEIQFLFPGNRTSYELRALGVRELTTFHCSQAHLQLTVALVLVAGTGAEFRDCHIESPLSTDVLIAVFGSLKLTRGSVKNVDTKSFALFGGMQVSETVFEGNRNSLFAAQSFGLQLEVRGAEFRGNTSPAGAVLLLGLAGTGHTSATRIRLDECVFLGNGAFMGGSFMYLSVSPNIDFTSAQMAEQRSIEVRNCTFHTNPGFLVIAFSKYVNVTFSGNDYSSHNYGFLIDLYDSSFTISASTVNTISRFLISRYISGLLCIEASRIWNVMEGPAIVLQNGALMSSGFVSIDDVEVRNAVLLDSTQLSSTLVAVNVAIRVTNLHVAEGYTYACACGCYSYCAAVIDSPQIANITAEQGALVAFLGSVATVDNAFISNVTVTRVALTGIFISTVTFRHTTVRPGASSFAFPAVKLNVHVAFDSTVSIHNALYDFPPLRASPSYYLWASTFECVNITYLRLYSRIADVYSVSTLVIRNFTVGEGYTEYMMLLARNGYALIEHLTLLNFAVKLALITVTSNSEAEINDVYFENVKFSALLIASNSKVALSNMTLRSIEADTLFWYITSCQMDVSNLSVFDSKFDLMQFSGGAATFTSITLRRVTVRRRFITLRATTMEFDGVVMSDLSAISVTPFCSVQKSSFTLRNSTLQYFRSREQGLMQLHNSSLLFINSEVSDFNVTFISASKSSISVLDSTVREGGLRLMDVGAKAKVSAGFLEAEDSIVLLEQCTFEGVTGTNGGVVSLESIRGKSNLRVQLCHFENCGALKDGGIVRAISTDMSIAASSFTSNSADRGGCIYYNCFNKSQCSSSISSSVFTNNTAREGGVLKWTFARPSLADNYGANNTAKYGPFEASVATHMSLLRPNASALSGVSGVIVVEPILIAFLDVADQVVATDCKSAATLNSEYIIGTTYLLADHGVANFSSVMVQTVPGRNFTVEVFSPTVNSTFPGSPEASFSFVYNTRECVVGEVSTQTGCFLCPKNTYSVHPADSKCRECPKYATCPGAFSLILDKGYWRPSVLSDRVFVCPVTEACEGGQNSTCSEAYTGMMCMRCRDGYYSYSQANCAKCESLWLRVFRTFILLVTITCFSISIIRQTFALKSWMEAATSLIIRRMLLNFLQCLLVLPLLGVNWKPELLHLVAALEMLLSFALTSVVTDCLPTQGDTWKPVFVRALMASALPFLLLLATGVVFLTRKALRRKRASFRHYYQSCLILLYIVHPYITKSAVSLVICMRTESDSYWLVGDVSVKCWDSDHLRFLYALFIPMALLLVIGVPAASIATVLVVRKRPHRKVIHFFIFGYTPNHRLWECGVLISKPLVMLTVSLLRLSETIIQIIITLAVLYCVMEWHIRKKPFISPLLNKLEGFSRFFQLLFIGTSFYYQVELSVNPAVLSLLAVCSIVIVCAFVAALVVIDIRSIRQRHKVRDISEMGVSHSTLNPMVPIPSLIDLPAINVEVREEAAGHR